MRDEDEHQHRAGEPLALVGYTFTLAVCFSLLATRLVVPTDTSPLMAVARMLLAAAAAAVGARLLLALRRHR